MKKALLKNSFKEIKEQSRHTKSAGVFVCSSDKFLALNFKNSTLPFDKISLGRAHSPTSTARIFFAPSFNRQSVNPPFEQPTSTQYLSAIDMPNCSIAFFSFSPPNEAKDSSFKISKSSVPSTSFDGCKTVFLLTLTKPSFIRRLAYVLDFKLNFSVIKLSNLIS